MTTTSEMQYPQGGGMDAHLESVLDAYATSEPGPSRATLDKWIREYPQFARELTEFTAQWQLLEWVDEASAADAAEISEAVSDDDRLYLRGMSAAQGAFYALRAQRQAIQPEAVDAIHESVQSPSAAPSAPISSLLTAAKRVGLSFVDLRDQVSLSDALLRKLDRRLIDPLTVPCRVVSDLAAALKQRTEAVTAYLALPPTFAVGAQHRASQAPALPKEKEDFFEAVRNDAGLSADRKREILALPRPDVGGAAHER